MLRGLALAKYPRFSRWCHSGSQDFTDTSVRLAKYVARCGLCSRRNAEEWIKDGRVSVNDKVIITPAHDVLEGHSVKVDGAPILPERPRLFLHYKRKHILVQHTPDPDHRPTIKDVLNQIPGLPKSLMPVGRLDYLSEGLILLTNDGELARFLELPESGVFRVYNVVVVGKLDEPALANLVNGVRVGRTEYGPVKVVIQRKTPYESKLEVSLLEGKNREVRKIMAHLGLRVKELIRVSYGPYSMGNSFSPGDLQEVTVKAHLLKKCGPMWLWRQNKKTVPKNNELNVPKKGTKKIAKKTAPQDE